MVWFALWNSLWRMHEDEIYQRNANISCCGAVSVFVYCRALRAASAFGYMSQEEVGTESGGIQGESFSEFDPLSTPIFISLILMERRKHGFFILTILGCRCLHEKENMKRYHKSLLIFAALLVFQSTAFAWNTYSDLAVAIAKDVDLLLVEHRVCKNINQCQSPLRVSAGGTPNQANVSVYEAGDLSPAIIQGIVMLCLDAYALHATKQTIILKFFRETSKETNAWFSRTNPFIYLELKGGN